MLETSAALANMMVTLSRLCQDLYTWHTEEFDFVVVSDEYAGSSSMMPQKKNPYPFEYVRARAAHATGDMASVFGTLHNTNFQDIKDVEEETVYPVIRLFGETTRSLRLLGGTIFSMEFKRDNMLRRAAGGFASCTELAAKIHRQTGLSYRTTHRIVGNLVLRAYKQGKHATDVDAALVNEAAREVTGHDLSIDDTTVRAALDPRMFVEAHDVPGGPAPPAMAQAIKKARTRLEEHAQRVRQLRENLRRASNELTARVQQLTRQAS
jgi:argininosuccinate lyase